MTRRVNWVERLSWRQGFSPPTVACAGTSVPRVPCQSRIMLSSASPMALGYPCGSRAGPAPIYSPFPPLGRRTTSHWSGPDQQAMCRSDDSSTFGSTAPHSTSGAVQLATSPRLIASASRANDPLPGRTHHAVGAPSWWMYRLPPPSSYRLIAIAMLLPYTVVADRGPSPRPRGSVPEEVTSPRTGAEYVPAHATIRDPDWSLAFVVPVRAGGLRDQRPARCDVNRRLAHASWQPPPRHTSCARRRCRMLPPAPPACTALCRRADSWRREPVNGGTR